MKLNKSSHISLKSALLPLLVVVMILVGVGYWLTANLRTNSSEFKNANDNTLSSDKKDLANSDSNPDTYPNENSVDSKSPQQDPEETGKQPTPAIRITNASQQDGFIAVRAIAEGIKSGTCRLELSKSGLSSIIKEAPLTTQANYVICQGFNIPLSEFSENGTWSAAVKLTSQDLSVTSETKIIEITRL